MRSAAQHPRRRWPYRHHPAWRHRAPMSDRKGFALALLAATLSGALVGGMASQLMNWALRATLPCLVAIAIALPASAGSRGSRSAALQQTLRPGVKACQFKTSRKCKRLVEAWIVDALIAKHGCLMAPRA